MATTEFGTSSVHNVQHWSRTTFKQAISRTLVGGLMGSSPLSPIQRLSELEKGSGDTIRYDLRYQMEQWGVEGDNRMAGFEEGLVFAQDTVKIDQRRIGHAVRGGTQMRTVHDLRVDGRDALSDRYAVIWDSTILAQLAGRVGNSTTAVPLAVAQHAGNALVSPTSDTDHYLNKSTEAFRTNHIEILLEKAANAAVPINPARSPLLGGASYILIVHPNCITDLRMTATGNNWIEVTKFAYQGKSEGNPFFNYVVGKWGDTVILSSRYIPKTDNVAHCLFLGAQAGVVAFGNAFKRSQQEAMEGGMYARWAERLDDFGNEEGVSLGSVYGAKASVFTKPGDSAKRFGMIAVDILATAH